jgi:D-alanine-D-alanine ligase
LVSRVLKTCDLGLSRDSLVKKLFVKFKFMKKRLALIFGGKSGEHEVSLVSATSVLKAIDLNKYEVSLIGIDTSGRFFVGEDVLEKFKKKDFSTLREISVGEILCDVAFAVLHGSFGEDGKIQGMFEMLDVAYVGCDSSSSVVCMDKDFCKKLARDLVGVNIAQSEVLLSGSDLEAYQPSFGFPCFVKPARLGSAVGVTKVKFLEDLSAALKEAFLYDSKVLVEKALEIREIELGVLGNEYSDLIVSKPGEVLVGGEFYDFNDKYVNGVSSTQIPADLSEDLTVRFQNLARDIFWQLGLCGLARIDFFLDKNSGEIFLNEINTMPGFTSISMYPKLMEESGVSYGDLIDKLVELALEAKAKRDALKVSFESGSDWFAA